MNEPGLATCKARLGPRGAPMLRECVDRVCIVAWREDTSLLERALAGEGFSVEVVRPTYSDEELTFSRMTRCLINHRSVWRRCASQSGLWIVVEADFAPCKGFGSLPLPFPIALRQRAWGWLYACGPRLYERLPGGFLRGHACSTVAYVLGPEVAGALAAFSDRELAEHDPRSYYAWDTYLQYDLKRRQFMSFLPFRQYGEHGGGPNREHAGAGIARGGRHHADVLWAPTAFLPAYANGRRLRYAACRLFWKTYGVGRLLTGRFVDGATLRACPTFADRVRMLLAAFCRVGSLH